MTLRLTEVDDGTVLSVRVTPRASRTQLDGELEGALRVKLKAPPVDGAANKALCSFFAEQLRCRKRDVEVIRGIRSREKSVLIRGMGSEEVRRLLES